LPRLVLDGSVTVAWFLADEVTAATSSLFEQVAADGALVPALWHVETGHVLLVAERHGRIDAATRRRALNDLRRLQIETDDQTVTRAWDATMDLAARFRLTLYDAVYLELAQRTDLPIATLDRALAQAAGSLGIPTLPQD
jgi:predicted nucleic acid-binding protein